MGEGGGNTAARGRTVDGLRQGQGGRPLVGTRQLGQHGRDDVVVRDARVAAFAVAVAVTVAVAVERLGDARAQGLDGGHGQKQNVVRLLRVEHHVREEAQDDKSVLASAAHVHFALFPGLLLGETRELAALRQRVLLHQRLGRLAGQDGHPRAHETGGAELVAHDVRQADGEDGGVLVEGQVQKQNGRVLGALVVVVGPRGRAELVVVGVNGRQEGNAAAALAGLEGGRLHERGRGGVDGRGLGLGGPAEQLVRIGGREGVGHAVLEHVGGVVEDNAAAELAPVLADEGVERGLHGVGIEAGLDDEEGAGADVGDGPVLVNEGDGDGVHDGGHGGGGGCCGHDVGLWWLMCGG